MFSSWFKLWLLTLPIYAICLVGHLSSWLKTSSSLSNAELLNVPYDVDIVLSRYRENVTSVSLQILRIRQLMRTLDLSERVIVYVNDESARPNDIPWLQSVLGADTVVLLPNRGREGGSFLKHIVSHYDASDFAPHTLFGQALLEYEDIVSARVSTFHKATAFMSLAEYTKCNCGRDTHGSGRVFPRMREIYAMFQEQLCPGQGHLCSYKGQFIVSRRQILRQPKSKYESLLDILDAQEGHWIFDDEEDKLWEYRGQRSSPSAPYFGHAVELSWAFIFGCADPFLAERCSAATPELCQCLN